MKNKDVLLSNLVELREELEDRLKRVAELHTNLLANVDSVNLLISYIKSNDSELDYKLDNQGVVQEVKVLQWGEAQKTKTTQESVTGNVNLDSRAKTVRLKKSSGLTADVKAFFELNPDKWFGSKEIATDLIASREAVSKILYSLHKSGKIVARGSAKDRRFLWGHK